MLNFISTNELDIKKHCENGFRKLLKFSRFNRFFIFFWLLGPFIYLIERDPADLWLTLLFITFLIRCFILKEWNWATQTWFKITIVFWIYCILIAFFTLIFKNL